MASASGKISRIFVKDCDEDQYGNNKRKSIQLEGSDTWYGLGTGKGDGLRVKKGKDWVEAKVGDSIEFLYEERPVGDKIYCNAKVSDIKLKASAAPNSAASAPSGQAKQGTGTAQGGARTGGSTGGKSAGYEAGIKVGHAINNAVQLVCAEEGKPTLAAIERKAIAILKLSRKMETGFEAIFDGSYTPMEEKAAPAPAPEPEAKAEKPKRTTTKKKEEPAPEPDIPDDDTPPEDPPADDPPEDTPEPETTKKVTSIADFDDDIPF